MKDIPYIANGGAMLKLKRTLVHLNPTDQRRLSRIAATMTKQESRRVSVSELVRRAIREFLAKQEG
jgi:hypothetical protein